ncbi:MAG TPA: VTT domain-containing protein [Alphaproteobacteria bacterium]
MKLKPYLRGLVLIATFVAIGYFVQASGLHSLFDETWVDHQIRGQGFNGELLFLAVGAITTAVGFPRQAICFLAGYAFGFAFGLGLALVASVGGCILAFGYARLLGRSLVLARFPERIKRLDAFLHDNPLSMTLLLRLLPVGSNLVTNLAAGVSGVRAVPFFLGSLLGYLPQTVIFVLLGSGIRLDPAWTTGISAALFVVSSALGVYLFRRYRKNRALDGDVAAAFDDGAGK